MSKIKQMMNRIGDGEIMRLSEKDSSLKTTAKVGIIGVPYLSIYLSIYLSMFFVDI